MRKRLQFLIWRKKLHMASPWSNWPPQEARNPKQVEPQHLPSLKLTFSHLKHGWLEDDVCLSFWKAWPISPSLLGWGFRVLEKPGGDTHRYILILQWRLLGGERFKIPLTQTYIWFSVGWCPPPLPPPPMLPPPPLWCGWGWWCWWWKY